VTSLVSIDGIGLATPLGGNARETWSALTQGRMIRDHASAASWSFGSTGRIDTLACRVACEALDAARWPAGACQSSSTALIVGTSKGPVEAWINGRVALTGLSSVAHDLARRLEFGDGPRLTISAACSSGLHALIRAVMMLQAGEVDRALVIGAEASVHPLFIGSFRRLGVLPPEGHGCRPFDLQRKGFLMSDAAAAVCLSSSGSSSGLRIEQFALASDATHLTGSDPSGAILRRVLEKLIGNSKDIDLIHAHGTGTLSNDAIELSAINESLRADSPQPVVYSHKGSLGHSLGAAGLVSIVLNCLIHQHQLVPAMPWLTQPIPAANVSLSREPVHRTIKRSIALAAGFGGPIAAVTLGSH
jgi:3-oxoacyl-[acyl-carrier-protein] synthase II